MSFKNKVVLVTGGAGFIGSHIADKVLEESAEKVIILDDFSSGLKKNIQHLENKENVQIIEGDIRDFDTVKPLVQNSDYIFNEAASKLVVSIGNPRRDLETNITGTFNVIQAAMKTNARIVHASTGSVFGSSDKPMKENHVKNPTTPYGISKLSGEKYCLYYAKEFGLKASVIRYFHVFGPRQDYSGEAGVINIFLARVLKNKPPVIFSGGDQIRCFTYISDDVDATLLIAKSNNAIGEEYNVASKTRMSINELANTIIGKYGKNGIEPIHGKTRRGENPRPIPDTTKIENLGFKEKVSFEEGLDKTKRWVEEDIEYATKK